MIFYMTTFEGGFKLTPPPSPEQLEYLHRFRYTKRMKRDPSRTPEEGAHTTVGLPLGPDSCFYVGTLGGQGLPYRIPIEDVVDLDSPPEGQPSQWCQWVIYKGLLVFDGVAVGEKCPYREWLYYMVEHFFRPWGINVQGEVFFQGTRVDDIGVIRHGRVEDSPTMWDIIAEDAV